jgi:hypothetical protein
MSEQPVDLTRRQVLLGALSAFIVGCTDVELDVATELQFGTVKLTDTLSNLIANPDATARLGRSYLDAHPEYQTADALLNAIDQALIQHDAEAAQQMDSHRVAEAIKKLVASEYTHGDVESVAGWILSVTEARLYGFAAMGTI